MIRSMREIAAVLRDAAHEAAAVGDRLRGNDNDELFQIGINVQAIASSLLMYASTADAIARREGEPELPPIASRCRYGCENPVTCKFPHAGCNHCATARLSVEAPALADLIGAGVCAVDSIDVDAEADAAVRGSGL